MTLLSTGQQKKHPSFILGVTADYFKHAEIERSGSTTAAFGQGNNKYPSPMFVDEVQSYLVIREREALDELIHWDQQAEGVTRESVEAKTNKAFKGDRTVRQILPYLIARQIQVDGTYLYFPYRRTKKVGESRLAGNISIGYGGHPELSDLVFDGKSVIDLQTTILLACLREAVEEFKIIDGTGSEIAIDEAGLIKFGDQFIMDDTNDVGALHIGVVMLLEIPFGCTVQTKEDELTIMEPMTAAQILGVEVVDGVEAGPENWTAIYLASNHPDDVPKMTSKIERAMAVMLGYITVADMIRAGEIEKAQAIIGDGTGDAVAASLQAIGREELDRLNSDIPAVSDKIVMLNTLSPEDLAKLDDGHLSSSINPYEFDGMTAEQLKAIPAAFIMGLELNAYQAYAKRCGELGVEAIAQAVAGSISDGQSHPYAKYDNNFVEPTADFPKDPYVTTESGLIYTDYIVGAGAEAKAGQNVTVHYTGWLSNSDATKGAKFDSSHDRNDPFQFALGVGMVIRGWDEGVQGMKVGGLRQLRIKPELGYGSRGAGGVIPPDAVLIFDIELLAV